jgi:uncharacterized protein YjdB/putative cell wall-binding protein
MKRAKQALASLAIASMALTMVPFKALADPTVTSARLFGSNRVGTAIAVADAGWSTAGTVILASSADANLVDALAAAPLAGKESPILLTDNNILTDTTEAELVKLGAKTVYIVGAINKSVVDKINALGGIHTIVLKGDDRIGTASAIAAKLVSPAGSFVVGYGALADALSVASYAAANNYSILVANPDGTLPDSEAIYKGSNVYLIGGSTLVADIPSATRLFGKDRFATNQAVIKALTYKYDKAYLANGTDAHLVDSLVASSLAAKYNAPIILGSTDSATVLAAADVHVKLTADSTVTALGGTAVVPDSNVKQVTAGSLLDPMPPQSPVTPVSPEAISITGRVLGAGAQSSADETTISNDTLGGSRNIVLTVVDSSGNPIVDKTVYLGADLPGLWITQVNGVTLTGSVNMGTTGAISMQTINTPVPVFHITSNVPAYDDVDVSGISVHNLKTTPVIALQTGADGTICLTLADGNVSYVATSTAATTANNYVLSSGAQISAKTLNFYSDSTEKVKIGSMPVNWGNSSNPSNPSNSVSYDNSDNPVSTLFPVTGVSINTPTVALTAGGATYPLVATITPKNATIAQVAWSTSNAGVATVSSTGVVTPVSAGTATITVTTQSGVYTASSIVTVAPEVVVPVTGLTLDKTTLALTSGTTGTLTATLTPITATNKIVLWSTSNTAVATVVDGRITSVGVGKATITATSQDGAYLASCLVSVSSSIKPVGGIILSRDIISLKAGGTPGRITATVLPSDATNSAINWTSSDSTVVTVSSGVITPLSAGIATITATALSGGKTATCTVVVTQ